MRKDPNGDIVLSERNLLALAIKNYQPGSARTLVGGEDCESVTVRAESDDEHYGKREYGPGPIHPLTARILAKVRNEIHDYYREQGICFHCQGTLDHTLGDPVKCKPYNPPS